MKRLLLAFLLMTALMPTLCAQCNITIQEAKDSSIHYTAQKETVYTDERFESGILFASLQLEVWQNIANLQLLQSYLYAWVVKKGNKPLIVPRRIKITFSDGTFLDLTAETIQDPRDLQGATVYICEYYINMEKYLQFQKKSVSEIIIIDNRTNEKITCNPYPDLLKEQANCIGKKLKL